VEIQKIRYSNDVIFCWRVSDQTVRCIIKQMEQMALCWEEAYAKFKLSPFMMRTRNVIVSKLLFLPKFVLKRLGSVMHCTRIIRGYCWLYLYHPASSRDVRTYMCCPPCVLGWRCFSLLLWLMSSAPTIPANKDVHLLCTKAFYENQKFARCVLVVPNFVWVVCSLVTKIVSTNGLRVLHS
jgi:hypothetical protein